MKKIYSLGLNGGNKEDANKGEMITAQGGRNP